MAKDNKKDSGWNAEAAGAAMSGKKAIEEKVTSIAASHVVFDKAVIKKVTEDVQAESKGNGKKTKPVVDAKDNATKVRLKSYIDRIEKLEEERRTIGTDIKEVYGEAKAFGFDTPTIKDIVRLRRIDNDKRKERFAILELYCDAVQLDLF